MELSKRTVGIVIAFLLIAAASTPFVFFSHYPDYDEAIELTVTYRHHDATYDSQDGWDTQIVQTNDKCHENCFIYLSVPSNL